MGSPKRDNYLTGYTPKVRGVMAMLLTHLSRYTGKTSEQVYQDFVEDYGSMAKRVLLRYLANLIRLGCVRRDNEAEFDFEIGQLRPVYFLVTPQIPRVPRKKPAPYKQDIVCPHCGMWAARAASHPLHINALRIHRAYLNRHYIAGGDSAQRPAVIAVSPPGRTIAEMSTSPQPGAVSG